MVPEPTRKTTVPRMRDAKKANHAGAAAPVGLGTAPSRDKRHISITTIKHTKSTMSTTAASSCPEDGGGMSPLTTTQRKEDNAKHQAPWQCPCEARHPDIAGCDPF